jgi:hypothetical protein
VTAHLVRLSPRIRLKIIVLPVALKEETENGI